MKFDLEDIQKRLKPPDYQPEDKAKVRQRLAEKAKKKHIKLMRELVRDEK